MSQSDKRLKDLVMGKNFLYQSIVFALVFLLGAAPSAEGKIYTWKDENGRVHFTDDILKVPKKSRQKLPADKTKKRKIIPRISPSDSEIKKPVPRTAPAPAIDLPTPPPRIPETGKSASAEGAETIFVSLLGNRFAPVGLKVAAVYKKFIKLKKRPKMIVSKNPLYQGVEQKYGTLRLGDWGNPIFQFVLDVFANEEIELYVDVNQNGDMTDDGGPWLNEGSGRFATEIRIPVKTLRPDAGIPGDVAFWFFTNDGLWPQNRVTYYTRTQWLGKVRFGGGEYSAVIADRKDNKGNGVNDGNFTNDGIFLDLDGDGKWNRKTEYFPHRQPARINGRDYIFSVTW